MTNKCDYDVIIVGGGIVGATLAQALRPIGLRLALIDSSQPIEWQKDQISNRVSAITQGVRNIFDALKVWDAMVARRVTAFKEMHVWEQAGSIHFDCSNIAQEELGYIVENSVIHGALMDAIEQNQTIDHFTNTTLQSISVESDKVVLRTATEYETNNENGKVSDINSTTDNKCDEHKEFSALLVVGADGANSWVRSQANMRVKGWAYDQNALVTTIETEKYHQQTAWQRFLPTGPLALLPITNKYCSVVWSVTQSYASDLMALDENAFIQTLQSAFGDGLGCFSSVTERQSFPLKLSHAPEYSHPRITLVGDAAHTIHPLAGQGVNLGILDAASLAEVLTDAQRLEKDIGGLTVLRRYERWRKGENLLMAGTMEFFKRLFSNNSAPLRWARNTGLNMTQATTPVKNTIMRRAMMLTGDIPKLAKGIQI